MEVRAAFGAKLRHGVQVLNSGTGTQQRASKYAAMLPLAGMDPALVNRRAPSTWAGLFQRRELPMVSS